LAPARRPPAVVRPPLSYDLDLSEDDDTLYVSLVRTVREGDRQKTGVTSPKRVLAAAQDAEIGAIDHEICDLLGGSSLPLVAVSLDEPDFIEALFEKLIESGRCYWSDGCIKLGRGPERRILVERNARDGRRRLLNAGKAVRLLNCDEPWYVDLEAGEVGPAEVEEMAAATFAGSAQGRRQGRHEEKIVIIEEEPVPVLLGLSGRVGGEEQGDRVNALQLQFEYGDRMIREDEPNHVVRVDGDDGPAFVRRERSCEERAANVLQELGLSIIRIMSESWQPLGRAYAFRGRNAQDQWADFVLTGAEELRRRGWRVELGGDFRLRVIEVSEDWDVNVLETGQAWFALDVGIVIEGERFPLLPILVGILERGGIEACRTRDGRIQAVLDDGRVLALPADRVAKFLTMLDEMLAGGTLTGDGKLKLTKAEAANLASLEEIVGTRWQGGHQLLQLGRRLRQVRSLDRIEPPEIFHASLRPYQRDGLDWLQFLRANDIAGILADDMGLGKTAQTLAHISVEKEEGRLVHPCLIVVPTSLVPNWIAEAHKFVPSLRTLVLHGPDRHSRRGEIEEVDLVVTTYAILARDIEYLETVDWHIVVLDEAQAIKNPLAKATRAACRIKARHRLCLTGTPIENHLGEVWSQFAFLMPGLLGSHRDFNSKFRVPIEKHEDATKRQQLGRRLRPFILRRTKGEVATDLPPKTEIVQRVELAGDQLDLYETIRVSMHEKVRGEIARLGLARSRIVILDALLKLRQVCCDPRLVKLDSAKSVTGSGKLESLIDMMQEMVEAGRRILVFSQFTSMLDLIKLSLKGTGIDYVELRGDTADRATPVKRFQNCEIPLFLISLKAGGKGLNLTAADTVIHYDPWWNPAVEDQATDRAHRIGQDKPVFVYKLIAASTVEERIIELQRRKGSLAGALLDEGSWVGSIENADIDYLFSGE